MSVIHDVKILPEFYDAVESGLKPWEYRFDDRNYAVGDLMLLREWKDGKYTGRRLMVKITYVLNDFEGLKNGWAILSIEKLGGKK